MNNADHLENNTYKTLRSDFGVDTDTPVKYLEGFRAGWDTLLVLAFCLIVMSAAAFEKTDQETQVPEPEMPSDFAGQMIHLAFQMNTPVDNIETVIEILESTAPSTSELDVTNPPTLDVMRNWLNLLSISQRGSLSTTNVVFLPSQTGRYAELDCIPDGGTTIHFFPETLPASLLPFGIAAHELAHDEQTKLWGCHPFENQWQYTQREIDAALMAFYYLMNAYEQASTPALKNFIREVYREYLLHYLRISRECSLAIETSRAYSTRDIAVISRLLEHFRHDPELLSRYQVEAANPNFIDFCAQHAPAIQLLLLPEYSEDDQDQVSFFVWNGISIPYLPTLRTGFLQPFLEGTRPQLVEVVSLP